MSAVVKFEKFANSEYGASAEDLSAALVVDFHRDRFKACRNGAQLILPKNAMLFLRQIGIVGRSRGHITYKNDVDWRRIDELLALRAKSHQP
jgi:hypothetical protein